MDPVRQENEIIFVEFAEIEMKLSIHFLLLIRRVRSCGSRPTSVTSGSYMDESSASVSSTEDVFRSSLTFSFQRLTTFPILVSIYKALPSLPGPPHG